MTTDDNFMDILKNKIKKSIGRMFKNQMKFLNKKIHIILMYHRVVEKIPEKMHDPHLFIKSDTFDMHIHEIAKYFEIVTLDEMLDNGNDKRRLCALTFDDGWVDNYETAFPILRENNVPAVIFIPAADIGTTHCFWFEHLFCVANSIFTIEDQSAYIEHFREMIPEWNPKKICTASILRLTEALKNIEAPILYKKIEEVYEKLNKSFHSEKTLMNWDQVREMGEEGIAFGSHGLQHDILPPLCGNMKRKIVFDSFSILKDKKVLSVPFFSYPNGNWDLESIEFLKEAGYHGAVTTKSGLHNRNFPFRLNRIGLSESSSNTENLLWFQICKAFYA